MENLDGRTTTSSACVCSPGRFRPVTSWPWSGTRSSSLDPNLPLTE